MSNRKKGAVVAAFEAAEDADLGAEPDGWGDDADLELDDEEKREQSGSPDLEGGKSTSCKK